MIDFTDINSVSEQTARYVEPVLKQIEKLGGVVDRAVLWDPAEARRMSVGGEAPISPWLQRYYGPAVRTWDDVVVRAQDVAYKRRSVSDISDSMRQLANNLFRQSTAVTAVARHGLSRNLSAVSRFRSALKLCLDTESSVYCEGMTDPRALEHYLDYIYKYSPLSNYCPDLWMKSVEAYGVHRQISLNEQEVQLLAEVVVALQKAYGITDHIGKLHPNSLEDTQTRALENNPKSAYSLPTMKNAKSKEARAESLELAYEYKEAPELHGNIPFVGNRRIQQGGNVLKSYLCAVDSSFDPAREWPTLALFDSAMDLIAKERPWLHYFSKDRLEGDRWSKCVALPNSLEARQKAVDEGRYPETILLKFSDGTFKFNYECSESCPWTLIEDDDEVRSTVGVHWHNLMKSKNRAVWAGSNPIALNKQAFVHKLVDSMKEWTEENGNKSLTAPWKEPSDLRKILTNMAACVNNAVDCNGNKIELPEDVAIVCGCLSGDDKSGFDNYQAWLFSALFQSCILSPCFGDAKDKNLIKWISLHELYPQIVTYKGLMVFDEMEPSGEGATNFKDTFISHTSGLFDLCLRSGLSPQRVIEVLGLLLALFVAQGDDYEGMDMEDADLSMKQSNYSKLGLDCEPRKSMVTKRGLEFVRLFSDTNWRVKCDDGSNHLALHAPLFHARVKVDFGEEASFKSPAIEEAANINRFANVQFHPNSIEIMKDQVNYTQLAMGTKDTWYVPEYLMKEWRKAGCPKPPSSYHVKIDSPQSLVKVASKEAMEMGSNLDAETGKSWQARWDDTTKFEELRVVKILNAIKDNNNSSLSQLKAQIVFEPMA